MIPKELIDRINELARKSRSEGLTEREQAEQQALRKEYLSAIRARVRDTIENTVIEEPGGKRNKLPRKE